MKRTLSLYIVSEILPPFLMGLMAFTFILLTARILKLVELLVTRGVPFLQIGKLFTLILPTFLEMTLPMALLLGILMGLSALSSDQEILAFKACGISPLQVFLPIGTIALFVSLLTLLITTHLGPAANQALKKELYGIAKTHVGTTLREKVFNDDFPKMLIYVEEVIPPGNTAQGVLIVDRRDPMRENIIFGKVAIFQPDESAGALSLKIFDGVLHERGKTQSIFSQTHFNTYHYKIEFDQAFNLIREKRQKPKEMSLRQLGQTIRLKKSQGVKPIAELMELHQRFSFPFTPLIFSLLGVAMVMLPTRSRTGRFWGLVSCLFWLLFYYTLLSTGKALAEREVLTPMLALWLPNVVVGLVAIYIFRKALQESPPLMDGMWQRISTYLSHKFTAKQRGDF